MALKFIIKGPPPFFWFYKSAISAGPPYTVEEKSVYTPGNEKSTMYRPGSEQSHIMIEDQECQQQ